MNREIGVLKEVDIKSVWPKEERDFTPWMRDYGLEMLMSSIGVDSFKEAKTEVKCGDGKRSEADLVAKYIDGDEQRTIVVENQYHQTDGDHLGRLLMYAMSQKASIVVWVAASCKREYIDTINWLNENCSSEVQFFLVQIHAFRIGDSQPAPMFEVVAKPEEETEVEANRVKERSESMDLCYNFWKSCSEDTELNKVLNDAGLSMRRPNTDRWKDFSIKSDGVWLSIGITTQSGRIKANITCKTDSPHAQTVKSAKFLERLQKAIGLQPQPGPDDRIAYSTINFYNDIDISVKDNQPAARKWFGEILPRLRKFLVAEKISKR